MAMIWFGIVRYLVDFLRETQEVLLLTMTGGRFWSLIAMIIGFVFLYILIHQKIRRHPTIVEFIKAVVGQLSLPNGEG